MKAEDINGNEFLQNPVLLHLEKLTGIAPENIPIDDVSLYSNLPSDAEGIPELGTAFMRNLLNLTAASSFDDLVKALGLAHGAGTWKDNAVVLIESGQCTLSEVIASREDVLLYLQAKGIDQGRAHAIMRQIYKGEVRKSGFSPADEKLLREHDVPDWYIESCKKIEYLQPKAHALLKLNVSVRLLWFKLYHPLEFAAVTIPPELGKSRAEVCCIEGDRLRLPYISIAGIGPKFAQRLEERAGPKESYASFRDFKEKIGLSILAVDALDEAGLLSGLQGSAG